VSELEERAIHQMQIAIAAADVDDESHARFKIGDVGEVLLGANAEIHATRRVAFE
jgi:hypothetical protein